MSKIKPLVCARGFWPGHSELIATESRAIIRTVTRREDVSASLNSTALGSRPLELNTPLDIQLSWAGGGSRSLHCRNEAIYRLAFSISRESQPGPNARGTHFSR